ncbi:MAG: hypothetical protein QN172_03645 [Armatimonadota bacterium]|nr:hypothetical protein [Armatimonadota bacterium]MDR7439952.1 hypothetical protein [Armatimonadota bacterium]MDR7562383.1 hypothetical protein [Armatimonadota bacterium]MDR7567070.1 hypothetical protein [Armatimonadota bacterium]MDR7601535.1 hypothetical protein [Armatimonadota bacterium]
MTPAFLHRLSTPEGRRRTNRWLVAACGVGFGLSGLTFGWDRWFFLLMVWSGVVYIPLRLALEWLGSRGRRQRQRYRLNLPDRITPTNLPLAAQALWDREVLLPRIVPPPIAEKAQLAVVTLGRRALDRDPSGEGIRKLAVRLAAIADGWMAELSATWPEEAHSIQARWRDVRMLSALMATARVLACLYEEVARQPFYGPGINAEALRTFVDHSLDFLDLAALDPELPSWRGELLGLWTPEAGVVRERWEAYCETPGPASQAMEALLEVLEA